MAEPTHLEILTPPPEPVYQDPAVTLYAGDCLEILRSLPPASFDAVITDPPYCSGGYLEAQKGGAIGQGHRSERLRNGEVPWFAADNMTTGGLVWLLRAVLVESRRLLKPNRSALVFTDWRMAPALAPALESSGLRYRNQIIWDKGSAGLGNGFKPAYEVVLEFTNGSTEYAQKNGQNVIRSGRVHSSERVHACQKPVEVLQRLIEVAVHKDGLILDPFCGSGSTLLAAKNLGRRAVGIDLDPLNCRNAADRMGQEVLPL